MVILTAGVASHSSHKGSAPIVTSKAAEVELLAIAEATVADTKRVVIDCVVMVHVVPNVVEVGSLALAYFLRVSTERL